MYIYEEQFHQIGGRNDNSVLDVRSIHHVWAEEVLRDKQRAEDVSVARWKRAISKIQEQNSLK